MTFKEFEESYGRAYDEWELSEDLETDEDYENEGWNAGYSLFIPPEAMLDDEDFMRGYDEGYNKRESEIIEEKKKEFEEKFGSIFIDWNQYHLPINTKFATACSNAGWNDGYAQNTPPVEMLENEDYMKGYEEGYDQYWWEMSHNDDD